MLGTDSRKSIALFNKTAIETLDKNLYYRKDLTKLIERRKINEVF